MRIEAQKKARSCPSKEWRWIYGGWIGDRTTTSGCMGTCSIGVYRYRYSLVFFKGRSILFHFHELESVASQRQKKSDRCSILRALNIFRYSYLAGIGPEAGPLEQPHSSLRELIIDGGANGGGIEWLTRIKVGCGKWEVEGECPRDWCFVCPE